MTGGWSWHFYSLYILPLSSESQVVIVLLVTLAGPEALDGPNSSLPTHGLADLSLVTGVAQVDHLVAELWQQDSFSCSAGGCTCLPRVDFSEQNISCKKDLRPAAPECVAEIMDFFRVCVWVCYPEVYSKSSLLAVSKRDGFPHCVYLLLQCPHYSYVSSG